MKRNFSLQASPTDNALWQQTLSGNQQAFGHLYLRFQPALKRYAQRLTGDSELIEDAIHDLFLTVWQSRQSLNATAPAGYYLANSLRNLIVRRLAKKQTVLEGPEEDALCAPSSEEDYLNGEEARLRTAYVDQIMGQLSPRQQEALRLHYFEAKSHQEIRTIMKISSQSLYNVLWRSLKTLRTLHAA
ncbi:RNA polymerase sigma factor [Larkinella sp. VNQ87]|uniref:RNA polymerase sigma factor n=1 Tax=Larkinella sp. VNQ87 TaxID=3400921 RepID=UPI003C0C2EA9